MNDKKCNICEDCFPNTEEYFYKDNKTERLFPYCKKCAREKANKWRKTNSIPMEISEIPERLIESLKKRFWSRVDIRGENDCWNWTGIFSYGGTYGKLQFNRTSYYAHRIAWFIFSGEFPPKGILVCHKCDNRHCCNPNHLFLGTYSENTLDAVSKGRWIQGTKKKR